MSIPEHVMVGFKLVSTPTVYTPQCTLFVALLCSEIDNSEMDNFKVTCFDFDFDFFSCWGLIFSIFYIKIY